MTKCADIQQITISEESTITLKIGKDSKGNPVPFTMVLADGQLNNNSILTLRSSIHNEAHSVFTSNGIVITNNASAKLTIESGKFVSKGSSAVRNNGELIITGGYFAGSGANPAILNETGGTLTIQGGYFTDNKATLPQGYEYKKSEKEVDGITYNYEVVKTAQ